MFTCQGAYNATCMLDVLWRNLYDSYKISVVLKTVDIVHQAMKLIRANTFTVFILFILCFSLERFT